MGQDKAFLELNGVPLIHYVIRAVESIADELLVVIGERPAREFASLDCRLVPDAIPGIGALGGIYTAIARSTFDYTLVLGCDMPLLSRALIAHLAAQPRRYEALIPSVQVENEDSGESVETLQPLHAIYSKRCLTMLEEQIEHGQYRVMDALRKLQVEHLREDELRRVDPELQSFLNANTPQALSRVRAALSGKPRDQER